MCRLARDLRIPRDEILYELPMAQGRALYCWCVENDPWMQVARDGPGYIAQQIQKQI